MPDEGEPDRKRTNPAWWQVGIGLLGLLLTAIATVGQLFR